MAAVHPPRPLSPASDVLRDHDAVPVDRLSGSSLGQHEITRLLALKKAHSRLVDLLLSNTF